MTQKKTKQLSKSSQRWLNEHHRDTYVKQAKASALRARSAYKLIEIQKKDRLIKHGMNVIDIGAAPGSWSLLAAKYVGKHGQVIAIDRLPMQPIPNVLFLQADLTQPDTINRLHHLVNNRNIHVILCDLAPNATGIRQVDQLNAYYLAELALTFAQNLLPPNGKFLVKVFQGEGFDDYCQQMAHAFKSILTRKPNASRPRSREVYLLGQKL